MADTPESVRVYEGAGVTVTYDVKRCIHFAECVRGLPEVFDTKQHPWVQPSKAAPELVAEVVRRCPSGALHYTLQSGAAEAPERPTRVTFVPDGPMTVRGELVIETRAGELAEVRATLCRCGLTGNQPFCDHACMRTGWVSSGLTD
jgi:uncharacterized Fe-S cluster protein YjdI